MQSTTRSLVLVAGWAVALAAGSDVIRAATISVPNASFESPATTLALPFVDLWQQVPPPNPSDPSTTPTGVFTNLPPPIDNCDGGQAVFLFAYPGAALLQDYDSTDYAHPTPLHAFNATFEPGKAYTLTVAVLGGTNLTYPMAEGTTLELDLYYRDSSSNLLTVVGLTITNNGALFPSPTHFVDFQVQVPMVKASDPWAGRHIGVQLVSTVSPELMGGYWDLDNVRLSSTAAPMLLAPHYTNGHASFTLQSEPGLTFEILASTNAALAVSNWTSLGTLTNTTGATAFTDPATSVIRRFYRARQTP
jgi:hypothetical protein